MNVIRGAIHRPVTVTMFVVAIVLFGVVSLDRLALNLLPQISYPTLTIQTDYEDSAPEEVENLITRPVEESVGVVPGLTRMSSISRSGQSEVLLEFGWDKNMDLAALDVREKLDLITFPRDVRRPVLLRFDPSNDPIMRLQLSGGKSMSPSRLRYLAEKELKRLLESTEGIAAIKVIGGLEEQIRIEIDEKRLADLDIPITEISNVLAQENLNQASGSLYDEDANYLVRILNQFRSVDEVRQIIIRDRNGRPISLGDVAQVSRGAKDREIIARLNAGDSVEMAIYKEGDANTVRVAEAALGQLEYLKREKKMPGGIDYQVVFNQATFIKQAVDDVLSSAILGGVLATLVLFLFLRDLRSTLTIGFTIPISIMATFAMMYQTDITLNLMSLGGVALGVGMLVDNAIVVLEAVHRHKEEGTDLAEAVFRGTREVSGAVTGSTLTTVAVFLPLIFVEGIAGQLFKDQALTITYSLVASLLVAITLIPMVLALRMKHPRPLEPIAESLAVPLPNDSMALESEPVGRFGKLRAGITTARRKSAVLFRFIFSDAASVILADIRLAARAIGRTILWPLRPALDFVDRSFRSLQDGYPKALTWCLDHKGTVIGVALSLAVFAGILATQIGAELIPPITQGEFGFEIRLPEGTPLSVTDAQFREIETKVKDYPEVGIVYSSIGGSNKNQFALNVVEENVGQLYVVMKDKADKPAETATIDRIRALLSDYPETKFTFSRPTFFSLKTPVEVEIYSFSLGNLSTSADIIAKRLARVEGLSDITTTTEEGNPEVQIHFDRERLARLGLEEGQIATILRSKIRGDVASRYREEDKQIEMLVRAREKDRSSIEDIRDLVINVSANNRDAQEISRSSQQATPNAQGSSAPTQPTSGSANAATSPSATSPGTASANTAANERRAGTIPIRLGAIADVTVGRGPSEVRRIRSQRAALVSANLTGRALSSASADIRHELAMVRDELPRDVTVSLGGQNEEMQSSQRSLFLALALAIFLVYLVMASQFESLIHPFLILFTVPFGLIGVVFALALTNTTFSVMVFLGVIILAGIVVNNAIVLMDFTRQLRDEGLPVRDALRRAGEVRMRPILMTTLTTVLGLIPMAIGWGEGAEVRAPMAISVIGGLSFSTVLTLFFIPVLYELVNRGERITAAAPTREPSEAPQRQPIQATEAGD